MVGKKGWLILVLALVVAGLGITSGALASQQVFQIPLLYSYPNFFTTYAFLDPLPVFGPAGSVSRVNGAQGTLAVSYHEFQQKVLPNQFYTDLTRASLTVDGLTFNPKSGTWVWGYKVGSAPQLYPGVTVEAQQGTKTLVTYTNSLINPGTTSTYPLLQRYITIDQTLNWANPNGLLTNDPDRFFPYSGPHPVVPHIHGGEVRSDSDGGPDEWWTPGGEGPVSQLPAAGAKRGPGYKQNVYTYPNDQESGTIWFHEHTLGATRTNVFAGLAAFWFIRNQYDDNPATHPAPAPSLNLPSQAQEIEIAFQDRQFDDNGQLLFPDGDPPGIPETLNLEPPNPGLHPYWIPEFFGNVIVVNGKAWPYLNVTGQRFRFHLLEGSNARFYWIRVMDTTDPNNIVNGPPIYVIGTDGGLLNSPVRVSNASITPGTYPTTPPSPGNDWLLMAPGERYDVIIDFKGFEGRTLTIYNLANAPFPNGDPVYVDNGTAFQLLPHGQLMQFKVSATPVASDTSYNPATDGALRGGANQPPAIVPLVDWTSTGSIPAGVTISQKRQLVLREVLSAYGPKEVLVNNTKFNGLRDGTQTPIPGSQKLGANWINEMPQVGSTEEWEIINLTGDSHPIHFHLVQFQVMNRESFNDTAGTGYTDAAYNASFPAGVAIDGYGPPLTYNVANADGAIGGNPAIGSYLTIGDKMAAYAYERGWKDTVIMHPGQVTRLIVRFAPQDIPVADVQPGQNMFSFNPTYGPGYVWHCHIVDHEDNEMMRPYIPSKSGNNTYTRYSPLPAIGSLFNQ